MIWTFSGKPMVLISGPTPLYHSFMVISWVHSSTVRHFPFFIILFVKCIVGFDVGFLNSRCYSFEMFSYALQEHQQDGFAFMKKIFESSISPWEPLREVRSIVSFFVATLAFIVKSKNDTLSVILSFGEYRLRIIPISNFIRKPLQILQYTLTSYFQKQI